MSFSVLNATICIWKREHKRGQENHTTPCRHDPRFRLPCIPDECMHACKCVSMCVNMFACLWKAQTKTPILLRSSGWCFWPGQRWSAATRRMHSEWREPRGEANPSQRHLRSPPIQYGPITAATKTTKTHEDFIDGGPNDRRPLSRQQLWERSQRSRWEEGERWRASLPKPLHN